MKSSSTKIIRAALYIRVSTEEQALHGDSLAAQEEELVRFAKENNMKVILPEQFQYHFSFKTPLI